MKWISGILLMGGALGALSTSDNVWVLMGAGFVFFVGIDLFVDSKIESSKDN